MSTPRKSFVAQIAPVMLPVLLAILGLGLISLGLGLWLGLPAGLIAAGVSLILLEWRIGG